MIRKKRRGKEISSQILKSVSRFSTHYFPKDSSIKKILKPSYKRTIISIILILLIFAIFWTYIFLNSPLYVQLKPADTVINTNTGEVFEFELDAEINNFPTCKATCRAQVFDISKGDYIFDDVIENKGFQKTLTVTMPSKGEGIQYYRYTVSCTNEDTLFCPGEGKSLQSSFFSFYYTVNDTERRKEAFKELNETIENLQSANIFLIQNSLILKTLDENYKIFNGSLDYIYVFDDILSTTDLQISRWNNLEYDLTPAFEDSKELVTDLKYENDQLKNQTVKYNQIVELTRELDSRISALNRAYSFYLSLSQIDGTKENSLNLYELRKNLTYIKELQLADIDTSHDTLIKLEKDINKTLQTYNLDLNTIIDNLNLVLEKHSLKLNDPSNLSYTKKEDLNSLCRGYNIILEKVNSHNQNVSWNNKTIAYKIDRQAYVDSIINITSNETNSIYVYNESLNNITFINLSSSFFKSKDLACGLNFTYTFLDKKEFNLSTININETQPSRLNISVSMPIPQCCFYGICHDCCMQDCDSKDYPVLFIHGHLFNKDLSPSSSLESLADLMEAIEPEGFIDYGQVSIEENLSHWSLYPQPVFARASYYYITYLDLGTNVIQTQKSERIENYAIRLKEEIDNILDSTGKDKIDIIGYSMGGLVARDYIDLFGEDKVDKLITLATPNNGITPDIVKACKITGSDKECEDMAIESPLIKRLQDQEYKEIKLYSIGAKGCDMNDVNGDGIVTFDSSILKDSKHYKIEGECSLGKYLHNAILDPEQYPETKEILIDILKD